MIRLVSTADGTELGRVDPMVLTRYIPKFLLGDGKEEGHWRLDLRDSPDTHKGLFAAGDGLAEDPAEALLAKRARRGSAQALTVVDARAARATAP